MPGRYCAIIDALLLILTWYLILLIRQADDLSQPPGLIHRMAIAWQYILVFLWSVQKKCQLYLCLGMCESLITNGHTSPVHDRGTGTKLSRLTIDNRYVLHNQHSNR